MNILTSPLPESVEIDGVEYPLNTDFRSCLRIMLAFEDNELAQFEKLNIMFANLYPQIPENINAAAERAQWFLNGGEKEGEEDPGPRVYSFSKDAGLIYSAFRQTHNIDLQAARLHWWEFLALFMDLGANTTFCNLVALRKRVKTGKATKEEKAAAREIGDAFEVPELGPQTLEERIDQEDFLQAVKDAKDRRDARKAKVQ